MGYFKKGASQRQTSSISCLLTIHGLILNDNIEHNTVLMVPVVLQRRKILSKQSLNRYTLTVRNAMKTKHEILF